MRVRVTVVHITGSQDPRLDRVVGVWTMEEALGLQGSVGPTSAFRSMLRLAWTHGRSCGGGSIAQRELAQCIGVYPAQAKEQCEMIWLQILHRVEVQGFRVYPKP